MRVLVVVTLVSPLGEYGGPLRVAVNQARALVSRGHEVVLTGSARGYGGHPPTQVDGIEAVLHPAVTLVPRTGFAGTAAPGLWRWLRRHAAGFDVAHVHAARDLVTLPAAAVLRSRRLPYVLQTHGMIEESGHVLARPLDALATRPIMRGARRVLYLTSHERAALRSVAGEVDLEHLPNGVPPQDDVATAATPTVLYLARLAPRKRPTAFVEAAHRLGPDRPGTRWVMIGPDEGEGAAVTAAIERARADGVDIEWRGPVTPEATAGIMRQASLYVLPSVDEPYPMSVLEAWAVGLPVVITDTCGLAGAVRQAGAGAVVDHSIDQLCTAVADLLDDPEAARRQGAAGRDHVRRHHGMDVIAARLESVYAG